jgi:D-glycero-alpha-D-manno-heptose-7-phosphate kinase
MLDRVEATAPCRVDLAGGTLDIWPLGLLHRGARTVNVAIDVEVEVELQRRERGFVVAQEGSRIEVHQRDQLLAAPESALAGLVAEHFDLGPFELSLSSESPRGAGLGASSALAVALIAAVERLLEAPASAVSATVHLARDLEARLMGLPTGAQDHYPALLGGALELRHEPGGERVRRLAIDLDSLGRSLVVAYSGGSHLSAANNFEVVARRLRGDATTTARLQAIAEAAVAMTASLERGDVAAAGAAMTAEWSARRELAPVVSTPEVEAILDAALAAGAWGGKVCGAGGGGCVAILAPSHRRGAVRDAVITLGHPILECRPTARGLRVRAAGAS